MNAIELVYPTAAGRSATSPPISRVNDGEAAQRFRTLQKAEIARVKTSVHAAILAAMQREGRGYPEGMPPRDLVRSWRNESALRAKGGEEALSPEEHAAQEAEEDAGQAHFQTWRDAGDEAVRLIDRGMVASIISGWIAEFLVKGETRQFRLDELTPPSPFEEQAAPLSDGGPFGEFESKYAA